MPLEEYKELVGNAAGVCTIAQFFAGAFICKDIIQQGSTKNISVTPFLGGLVIGTLMMIYALMLNDPAMITVNKAGMALNVLYFLCYFYYSNTKMDLVFQLMQGVGFVMLMFGYTRWEDKENVEFRYSIIITVLLMALIAAPLFSIGEIMRTKSTETLPFPLIFSGTIVSFLWGLYGYILGNTFIQLQNVVGFLLCIIQLSLFVIYPSKSKTQ